MLSVVGELTPRTRWEVGFQTAEQPLTISGFQGRGAQKQAGDVGADVWHAKLESGRQTERRRTRVDRF